MTTTLLNEAGTSRRGGRFVKGVVLCALVFVVCVVPRALSEVNVFRLGSVLIVMVGAIGLHILVNWSGELSLAHGALVGLPALATAKISLDHHVSPVILLPIASAIGVLTGGVIALTALRARGLQVAIVTLAAATALQTYAFKQPWLVGDGSIVAAPARLGSVTFTTSKDLYPILALIAVVACGVTWVLYRSQIYRGLIWLKENSDAASASGVPVRRYRFLSYLLGGGYAGLAGGLMTMWVRQMSGSSFSFGLSTTYLTIVVLAGPGYVGGVLYAAVLIEGGQLFLSRFVGIQTFIAYMGPIGLLLMLMQYRGGFNGMGRAAARRLRRSRRNRKAPKDGTKKELVTELLNLPETNAIVTIDDHSSDSVAARDASLHPPIDNRSDFSPEAR